MIKGCARNLDDGSLEVWAKGGKLELLQFEKFCRQGPIFAKVRKLIRIDNKNSKIVAFGYNG